MCDVALMYGFFFFQAEDGIRDIGVTGVQTCALPISKKTGNPKAEKIANGKIEIAARNKAPPQVILVTTPSKYSTVSIPGRIPGIVPPPRFRLSATFSGSKTIAV